MLLIMVLGIDIRKERIFSIHVHLPSNWDEFIISDIQDFYNENRKEVRSMAELFELEIPEKEQEEVKEFISTLLLLPKEDRAVLLSNANALKVRRDIERAREAG